MKTALFPGSFDPLTKAHVDIVKRSVELFDKLYIGVGVNSSKKGLLSVEQREQMIRAVFEHDERIHVIAYEGLTVDFCKSIGAAYMIRGIRTVSDFEYEKAIAQMNHSLAPDIESIFIVSKPGYSSISSTIVREIIRYNGDVSQFIPKEALPYL
ncbi:pantetheine-phosphate adenylyltransferase [Mucilaginibacter rubeus]|uniref:Phosphopantetheine adenylyltransferase n=1 Tax=Mucilaginibacter rubeus TaxID=2027860 RepID=A0AAE6JF59_9SPHI|nr:MULTISPECIES: pantetheine-phosphate adenylyltransferase [Mucilaginibacter]QEM03945.1 pantetheine-phosphate adenylyltransferase [Mucilaginibacter rubeus]QEM16553.1 pantetheine-phosphate adenylyltransferase [Mucilaginibacter gossypii]QTE40676.1 pantetheine-phosphate adenylyltransferase [Mucilaginibacter rubeus]QTE47278.1 pantetheine-phosphate adenylyltransferase [Mucilaginibacter rubeus]QTE58671.1 pantetheine-phosphate adenylyltransferase [Mucilaginibacter rubeus]